MKKIVFDVLVLIWIVITVFVTACLLFYNEYKVTEFGNTSLVVLDKKVGNYNKNDLIVVSKSNLDKVKPGDKVMYYDIYDSKASINISDISTIDKVSSKERTYSLSNDDYIADKHIIGPISDSINLSFLGIILGFLESKWGYLVFIILPMLCTLLYEIYAITKEIKTKK